ncbi:MAG: hypothetical protein KAU84_03235 [Thermoplasmatales archaeon]|nr:hypothetical protein [Thermoplasmatales archaeon]
MTKHVKAFRCRIENTGRIKQLPKNWYIPILKSKSLEETKSCILEDYPNENIVIKSDKGGSPYIKKRLETDYVGPISVEKNTTKWLRLIKSDGTVWTITDNHYVGEQIQ